MDYSNYLKHTPDVQAFFDTETHTITYVVSDPATKKAAVIDSVLDYEPNGAAITYTNADAVIAYVQEHALEVQWVLETHVHADHLSAAPYIQEKLGGQMAIGEHIKAVQDTFGKVFNQGTAYERDDSDFDVLFADGDIFTLGDIPAIAIHTPGHTPADMVYVIGDAVFAGDTLFMPDFGTARADFPGGSAEQMYDSIQKVFALPEQMRLFMCHDYLPEGRDEFAWETTIGEQKDKNIHVGKGIDKDTFVEKRTARDAELGMPKLIIPSIQVNIRGGKFPPAEDNGTVYLKTPVNSIFAKKKKQ